MEKTDEQLKRLLGPLQKDEISVPEGYSIPQEHEGHDSFTTVRVGTHRDKKIEIHTTYKILIDGEPLMVHTRVLDDGTVHCHSLPQYSFPSAMDMVRKIIDASDVELPNDELGGDNTDDFKKEEG